MNERKDILVLMVLYNISLSESKAYNSWRAHQGDWHVLTPKLLIYNNGAQPLEGDEAIFNARQNDMLAIPYNWVLQQATIQGVDWIILLDQDAEISADYIHELESLWMQHKEENVDYLMPRFVQTAGLQLPYSYNPTFFHAWKKQPLQKGTVTDSCVFTYNSGIVLRASTMNKIGGFSLRYPLDYQDADYLHRLYLAGAKGYTMHTRLHHNLSVENYAENMSPKRYQSLLEAEKQMAKDCGCVATISLQIYRLGRCAKWLFHADKRGYIMQTLRNII